MTGSEAPAGKRRVAVMGGTFDPIHHGHLFAAEEVADRFGLPGVIFMPCRQPPHKHRPDLTAAADRYRMTALAVAGNPRFSVSPLELERAGPSYTIDTLRELRRRLGPDLETFFITGADAVLEIMSWHEADAVLDECRLVAIHRPGHDLSRLEKVLGPQRAAKIEPLAVKTLDISSTDLRERVAAGKSIRYLTPDDVVAYIHERTLYRA